MKKSGVTLVDVAKLAGVSVMTASRNRCHVMSRASLTGITPLNALVWFKVVEMLADRPKSLFVETLFDDSGGVVNPNEKAAILRLTPFEDVACLFQERCRR